MLFHAKKSISGIKSGFLSLQMVTGEYIMKHSAYFYAISLILLLISCRQDNPDDPGYYPMGPSGPGSLEVEIIAQPSGGIFKTAISCGIQTYASGTVNIKIKALCNSNIVESWNLTPQSGTYQPHTFTHTTAPGDYLNGTYQFKFTWTASDGNHVLYSTIAICTVPEIDDTFATAKHIYTTPHMDTITSITDIDWGYYWMDNGFSYTITLSGLSSNLDFYLYDSGESLLDSSVNPGVSDEVINYSPLVSGYYYFKTIPNACSRSPYTITVSGTGNDGNDTFGTAPVISTFPFNGVIRPAADIDYYKVFLYSGVNTFSLQESFGDSALSLYNSSFSLVSSAVPIQYTPGLNDYYYLGVSSSGEETEYQIQHSFTQYDGNDDFIYASLKGNIWSSAIGWSTDTDWFKFNLNSGTNIVTMSGLTADLNMVLYRDPSAAAVGSSANAGTVDEVIVYDVPSPNLYYLRIYPASGGVGNYTVTITQP